MPAATMRSWAGKPDLTLTRWTSLADQPKRHQMTNFPKLTFLATVIAGLVATTLGPSALDARENIHKHCHSHAHRIGYDNYNYFRQLYAHGSRRIVVANHHQRPGKPRSVFVDPVGYAYPAIKYRNRPSGYRQLPDPPTSYTPNEQPLRSPARAAPQ